MKHLKVLILKDYIIILALVVGFLIIDQATKLIAVSILKEQYHYIYVLPFFSILLVYNTGISFSLLQGVNYYVIAGFSFLAMLVATYLLLSMFKEKGKIFYFSISLLIAGALGNLIDRLRMASVIDFFYLHYGAFSFPVFNFADIFITCCGAVVVYKILFSKNA